MKGKKKYIVIVMALVVAIGIICFNNTSFNSVKTTALNVKEDNETVSSTKLTSLSFDGYTLDPEFNKDTTSYNIEITSGTIDLIPNFTKEDSSASVKVENNKYLKADTGVITITVSKEGLEDTVYKVNYTRKDPESTGAATREWTFDYTGSEQVFTVPASATYMIETWGAQGGTANATQHGGYGSYSIGKIHLTGADKLYINVGGSGSVPTNFDTVINGGYNGGGKAYHPRSTTCSSYLSGSGGGATHVATSSGVLSSLENNKDSILIVSGGGGGGNYCNSRNYGVGGSGGGVQGQTVQGYASATNGFGVGATQTSAGCDNRGKYCGSFGTAYQETSNARTGGGGGYYGGGTSEINGGAGGSGFIGNANLTEKHMTCFNCTTSDEESTKTETTSNVSEEATTDYAKKGNGYAKISLMKILNGDNYLTSLTSSVGKFDKEFNPTALEYNLTIPYSETKFTLGGTTSNENADVVGFTTFTIAPGESQIIKVIVTAENGDTRTYKVNATRDDMPSDDTYLKGIVIDDNKYTIKFDPTIYEYSVELPGDTYDIPVTATAYNKNAKVSVSGNKGMFDDNGTISISVSLNGKTTKTYNIRYSKTLPDTNTYKAIEFAYTGAGTVFEVPETGLYKVELWGAQGGNGANGAYTSGNINLKRNKKLYIHVGGQGGINASLTNVGGYNGGGYSGNNPYSYSYGGGGATDLRLESGDWNSFTGLASRIMVAAGGGGSFSADYTKIPSAGGALKADNAGGNYDDSVVTGATQTKGGTDSTIAEKNGSFGYAVQTNVSGWGGGGGGGYYGGALGNGKAGSGGSSYISGYTGAVAITAEDDLTPRNDSEGNVCGDGTTDEVCSEHYSGYVFSDTVMKSGTEEMPSQDGLSTQTGNAGNGYAKITPISVSNNYYLKDLDIKFADTSLDTASKTSDTSKTGKMADIFDTTVDEYDVSLSIYQREIEVTGNAYDADSEVTGFGTYDIELGKTKDIKIVVTAASGNTKTYIIHAKRASLPEGQHLTKLNSLEVDGFKLEEKFDPYVNEYNVVLNGNTIDTNIIATSIDSDNEIEITGDKYLQNNVGLVKIVVSDPTDKSVSPTTYVINYVKDEITDTDFGFNYTGKYQTFTAPYTGKYEFRAWGASGGNTFSDATKGGNGAYTKGEIYLNKNDNIYVYVGGKGTDSGIKSGATAGGYNGGGNAYNSRTNCSQQEGSGGGATDFRLISGAWNDTASLNSRIMVAAGGGGAYYEYCSGSDNANITGAAGGALTGGQGVYISRSGYSAYNPTGATQTTGGKSLSEWTSTSYDTNYIGSFGLGSSGRQGGYSNSGAGGGYYGGASGGWQPGSGGSSYISGHTGSVAIKSATDRSPRIASDRSTCADGTEDNLCSVHYSSKTFENTEMISGLDSMPNYTETDTMAGNEGNGYAKIKFMNLLSNDYYLTSITSDYGEFDKEFDPIKDEYTLAVTPYDRYVTLSATTSDTDAKVSGATTYKVEPGETVDAKLVVTAQSGETKTYTVHIKSTEYNDKTTLLKELNIDKYDLTPTFNSNTKSYRVNIYNSEVDLAVDAKAFDSDAKVAITGNKYITGNTGVVTIKVTEDGVDPTTYTITYNKITPTMNNETYYYTGDVQEWTAPFSGKYKLEVWGGAAGYPTTNYGKGGYTEATFSIRKGTTLYIYVGGKGAIGNGTSAYGGPVGGWNGGGNGGNSSSSSGGGATDMRLTKGESWDTPESLYSRIIVAGGAGGSDDGYTSEGNDGKGGNGGGLSGQGAWIGGTYYETYGGTQKSGNALGKGADTTIGSGYQDTGGGGGGYYGGLATNNYNGGAGGGSSYIKGYEGTDDTYLSYQGENNIVYRDGSMKQGENTGAGYAKISFIELDSNDVYLNSLTSDHGTFDKNFDKFDGNYKLTLDKYVGLFTLSGELSDPNATVTGLEKYSIDNGETKKIPITVTSESGMVKVYTVEAYRETLKDGEHSSKLKSLSFDNYPLNEDFYSETLDYTMNIYSNEIDTDIHYTTYDDTAKVTVTGDKYIKHSPTEIKITVSAEGCEDTTYTINVTKAATDEPSKNNYLSSLESSTGTLDPEFDILKNNYTVHLNAYEGGTRLIGELDDSNAFADGLDKYYTVDAGETKNVKINVTAPSGDVKVYTVTLERDKVTDGHSTYLKSLSVNGFDDSIDFSPEKQEYNLTISSSDIDLDVDAKSFDSDATVTIPNTKHLVAAQGTIPITVSHDGMEDRIYNINYTKYDANDETFDYTGNYQTFTAPFTGKFTFELWGASGGDGKFTTASTELGGAGAYTKGTIELVKDEKLYIYVGQHGTDAVSNTQHARLAEAWNGGASGVSGGTDDQAASGGGATDIRLIKGNWNYNFGLASRIMVAAGGGGGHSYNTGSYNSRTTWPGINGQALSFSGNIGQWQNGTRPASVNQTNGANFGYGSSYSSLEGVHGAGGGGGGYYGGTANLDNYGGPGAGGSSYISGYTGSVAIKSLNDTTPRLDSEGNVCENETEDNLCSIHYSNKSFTAPEMIAGSSNMPNHDNTGTITGNTGNGFVRVTMEKSKDAYLQELTSTFGTFDKEFDPLKTEYTLTLGKYDDYFELHGKTSSTKASVTGLDEEIAISQGEEKKVPITVTAENGDTKIYTINVTREKSVDGENSTKLKSLTVNGYASNTTPHFSGSVNNYKVAIDDADAEIHVSYVPYDETAKIEVVGDGRISDEEGIITVKLSAEGCEDTTYKINWSKSNVAVGTEYDYNYEKTYDTFIAPAGGVYKLQVWGAEGGYRSNEGNGGNGGYSEGNVTLKKGQNLYVYVGGSGNTGGAAGGWNGGGSRASMPGGGGATDIRLTAGEWNNLDSLYSRLIVAGGGGSDGASNRYGGYAGGTSGQTANQSYGSGGTGATTTAAGSYRASFGQGGAGADYSGGHSGAGGGGWYGGGGANPDGSGDDDRGGGGGSGFVYDGTITTPNDYSVTEDFKLTDTKLLSGADTVPSYDGSTVMIGNTGNGHAKITLIKKNSKDNYLNDLKTDYGTLSPKFDSQNEEYTLHLGAYDPEFTLTGVLSDKEASVTGLDVKNRVANGETKEFDVVVTSTSGDIRTYKVIATRDAYIDSHSSKLNYISINNGLEKELVPGFNSNVTDYNLKIYDNLADFNITYEKYDEAASVVINGDKHLSKNGTVTITVTAPDVEKTVYKINYSKDKSMENYNPTDDDTVSTFEYTGNYQTYIAPSTGKYLVELWGAQGNYANVNRAIGGKGAYTKGIVDLEKDEQLYVYVGQNRTDRVASWNAGSTGGSGSDTTNGGAANGYGGGGATDVRLTSGTWNDSQSLASRIMVAAGGGGATNYSYPVAGGAGGALTGFSGRNGKFPSTGVANIPPTGATQTTGGRIGSSTASYSAGTVGSFGIGGNGNSSWGSAGGGGYYGGAGGGFTSNSVDSGAGGSSYISGYTGSVAIKSADDTSPRLDSNGNTCDDETEDNLCSVHYSGKIFEDSIMKSGEDKMPAHDGKSTMTGNSGNGYAKITHILASKDAYLDNLTSDYGTFDKKFDPLQTEYTLTLDEYSPTFSLTATPSDKAAIISGDGYYEMDLGETRDISILVIAASGDTKTYVVHVRREKFTDSHSSLLAKLKLNEDDLYDKLTPNFNSRVYDYTVTTMYNVIDLDVDAEAFDSDATVDIIGNKYMKDKEGDITINVTNAKANPSVTTYTIHYIHAETPKLEDAQTYDYTGKYQVFTAPYKNKYKLQVWGASGGDGKNHNQNTGSHGGPGGYSEGYVALNKDEKLYVYVGGQGTYGTSGNPYGGPLGGWNGGGYAGNSSSGSGGGATDIRKFTTTLSDSLLSWDNTDSLNSRIIVAGGGGGSDNNTSEGLGGGDDGSGGAGGGLTSQGSRIDGALQNNYATQTTGYALGQGQNVSYNTDTGGGGGGYYGGYATNNSNGGGSGGSGYIGGVIDGQSIVGSSSVPTHDNTSTMTGNIGNGYARITPDIVSLDNYLTNLTASVGKFKEETFSPILQEYNLDIDLYDEYVTIGGTLSDEKATVAGFGEYHFDVGEEKDIPITVTSEAGDVRTYTIHARRGTLPKGEHSSKLKSLGFGMYDLEPRFASLTYEYDLPIFANEIDLTSEYTTYDPDAKVEVYGNRYVKADTGTITVVVKAPGVDDTTYTVNYIKKDLNSTNTYSCTKAVQTFTAPLTYKYRLQAWGAQGGSDGARGGYGGYAEGYYEIKKNQTIYIYVGCQGASSVTNSGGGWNGGGNAGNSGSSGGGGGATHMATTERGVLPNYADYKDELLIVAGAGGGGGNSYSPTIGGAGGGLTGISGAAATGGTQEAGGSGNHAGSFGQGGHRNGDGGGGGGGYYGGGASGGDGGGAGGSSYIAPLTKGKTIDGNSAMPTHDNTNTMTGNTGNGFAAVSADSNLDKDNYLLDLSINKGNPIAFDKFTNTYFVDLNDSEITDLTINAKPSSDKATITGVGKQEVKAGANVYNIDVTSEYGETRRYTITVTRPASATSIARNITVTGFVESICKGHEGYCKLKPEKFSSDKTSYAATVPSGIRDLEFTVEKGHAYENVVGEGVTHLRGGLNTIPITITSEDGEHTTVYNYNIFRDMTGDNYLDKLEVTDPETDIGFNYLVTEYSFRIENQYDYIKLHIVPDDLDGGATFNVIGDGTATVDTADPSIVTVSDLNVGSNTVEIEVTAANGEKRSYVLNVYRLANSNTLIKDLTVTGSDKNVYELSPKFSDVVTSYTLNVPNEVSSVDISATADTSTTKITGVGTHSLNTGTNKIEVVSTAEDGTVSTYTIIITRAKSSNANLKELSVSEGAFNEEFNKDTTNYTLTVEAHTKSLNITATPEEEHAKYVIINNGNFRIGENNVQIVVTAEDGTRKTYTIVVTKEGSDDNYLKDLKVSVGDLDPVFDMLKNSYTVNVPNDITRINVTGTAKDTLSTVAGNGTYNLATGDNEIDITVTSETGKKNTYKVVVNRAKNSNNYLKDIKLSNGTLNPEFDKETTEYNVNVENSVSEITITGTPEVSTTTVPENGKHTLNTGLNKIILHSTAENGDVKAYTINITRDQSGNANLKDLYVEESILTPDFDKMTTDYKGVIPSDINDVHVHAITDDESATVNITGDTNLQIGDNKITVTVTAQNGVTKEYNITIKKNDKPIPYLSSLSVSNCSIIFAKSTPYYTCTVPYETDNVEVTAEADIASYIVGINGTSNKFNKTYNLSVGDNVIKIPVVYKGEDGTYERDYQVNITRLKSTESRLDKLTVSDINNESLQLTPEFDKDTFNYSLTTNEYDIDFKYTKLQEDETVTVTGNKDLKLGENTVTVESTSQDGNHTSTYTFTVTRTARSNAYLKSLSIDAGDITPAFNKEITNYYITVPYDVNSALVKAEAEDRNAVVHGTNLRQFNVGDNKVDITVVAEDGTEKVYTINVTRSGNPNNYLKSLSIGDLEYTPEFNRETLTYSLTVPFETDKVDVEGVPESEDATVLGNGEVNLEQGLNTINVVVTAGDGSIRTYTVNITRKDPITPYLKDIKVKNYTIDPTFESKTMDYAVEVDYETTKLDLVITKLDPYSSYVIEGNKNFKVGLNTVKVISTSSNRVDKVTYTITVNRKSYSNTFLSSLTVNQGTLDPEFVKTTMEYNVEVANSIANITVDGTPDYPKSTVEGFGDYELKVGKNVIHIVVTSPAGIQRTYIVNVSRRKSNDASIVSIDSNIGTLTKDDTYTYTLKVPKYTKNIGKANFTVKTTDPDASVSMPTTIDLSKQTTYTIKVTSPDGTVTKNYDINVEFDLSSDATLSALIPNVGELSPIFDRKTNEYNLSLFDDVDQVYFDSYLNEINAKLLNKSLTYNLTSNKTDAEISVQAENGDINIYKVHINRDKTKEKYLGNIEVTNLPSDVSSPSFKPKTFEYSLNVPYETSKVGFNITKMHEAQKISINGKAYTNNSLLDLNVGENTLAITTTNDLGEETTYTYTINRAVSTNANLKSLSFTDPEYEFTDFDKDKTSYNAEVDYNYENVTVKAVAEDPNAKVTTSGFTYLKVGENEATITVKAPSGATKVYTVYLVRRPEVNNLLKTITVSSGTIYPLAPEFRPGHYDYNVVLGSAISHVKIEPVPELNGTTVTITHDGKTVDATPGTANEDDLGFDLSVGTNSFTITSTRKDSSGVDHALVYTLNIDRLDAGNAYLKSLTVNNGTLVEEFNKTSFTYNVNVDNNVTSLDLTAIPEDNGAKVTISGNEDFTFEGPNNVAIKVKSSDGKITNTYNLQVHVKGENNNYLKDLQVDSKTVDNFDKKVENYYITLPNSSDKINIDATPESDYASVTSGLGEHDLNVGENEIPIVVTAQDGSTRTYTVYVTRKADAYLTQIITNLDEPWKVINVEKDKFEYSIGPLDHDINTMTVIGMKSNSNATIEGEQDYSLDVGDNTITLVVRNGDSKNVYTLKVNRKGSSNTNLTHLTSTDGDFDKVYSNSVDEYTIHINDYKTSLALSYAPEDNATITVIGNDALSEHENTVTLHIVAEDKVTTRDIVLHVFREDDSYFNSELSDLYVDEATISPAYKRSVKEYSMTVDQNVDKIHIHAIASSPKAVITGDGEQAVELGKNTLKITVTGEDGTQTEYTLIVFRKDRSNSDLTGLYTDTGELDPKFDPKTYNYTIDVPAETEKIHLTAVSYEEKQIEGDGDVYLQKGVTVRNIIVTSEDGHISVYKVSINRALSTNANILNITTKSGELDPLYNKDVTDYNLTVPDATDKITFNVTTESKLATVTNGNVEKALNYGDNQIPIYAQAEDGTISPIYYMHVHRIHDLSDITVPGDASGPKMDDGSENHISIQPGGTFDLGSAITFDPEDADYKDLIYTSNDTNVVTVDENGVITACDDLGKKTTITVQSKQYPNIKKTVNVTVEITLITSSVYDIEREKAINETKNYDPFITYIESETSINDFYSNLDNDPKFLHTYDLKGNEVTDLTKAVGTGFQVKLESNGHTYDTLDIIVLGDLNGDSFVNTQDKNILSRNVSHEVEFSNPQILASDLNDDGYINTQDKNILSRYISHEYSSLVETYKKAKK